jgi:hypothetical protein
MRAIGFHLDKTLDPELYGRLGGEGAHRSSCGCTTDLSPNGMVEKIKDRYWNLGGLSLLPPSVVPQILGSIPLPVLQISPLVRLDDHYSFLQAPSNHDASTLPMAVGESNPYTTPSIYGPYDYKDGYNRSNYEEVNAVTDPSVYSLPAHNAAPGRTERLLNPNFGLLRVQSTKAKVLSFTIPIFFLKKSRWPHIEWTLWRRTYHRLANDVNMHELHYMYRYVLK